MTDKNQTKPYWVLSRFRMAGKWLEVSDEPVQLTRLQAQGPEQLELISSTKPKPIAKAAKAEKAEKTAGGSDAAN